MKQPIHPQLPSSAEILLLDMNGCSMGVCESLLSCTFSYKKTHLKLVKTNKIAVLPFISYLFLNEVLCLIDWYNGGEMDGFMKGRHR